MSKAAYPIESLSSVTYQVGTATVADLLDVQTLYRQSCDRLSEAVATNEIKRVEYFVMTGR